MPKRRLVPVTDEQIVAAYAQVRSSQKVAKALGLGATTVHRVLKRHGVERVGLHEYRQTMGAPKTTPYIGTYTGSTDEILAMYSAGKSMRAIADKIGRSVHVVARRVKQAGIARPYQGRGVDHSMWTGGRLQTGQGYWRVWVAPDDPMASMRNTAGYVLEHRLVMARKLGRPLLDTETVHHINSDRGDNSPGNLELRQGKHGKHVVMCCLDCGSRNIGHVPLS